MHGERVTFRILLSLLVLPGLAAAPAAAQTLQGHAVERESLQPVPGATIQLVDSAGEPVAAAVTDSAGAFSVTAPGPGEFAVTAGRIGFRATVTRAVPLQAGETVAVEVRMGLQPVAIDTARVSLPGRAGISGRVLDDRTGLPVPEAEVSLLNSRELRVGRVRTDSAGVFHLPVREAGGFLLSAERVGYRRARSGMLTLTPRDTVQVELRVGTDAVVLAPLTVVAGSQRMLRDHQLAGFEWRSETQPWGRFMNRDQIKRVNPFYASDVLQQIPQVRVDGGLQRTVLLPVRGGRLRGPRYCVPNLYIDGYLVRMRGGDISLDELVRGSSLAGVEVYASPTSAPGEFPAIEDPYCGVVVIWTELAGES